MMDQAARDFKGRLSPDETKKVEIPLNSPNSVRPKAARTDFPMNWLAAVRDQILSASYF
jgi:hypothetical protein